MVVTGLVIGLVIGAGLVLVAFSVNGGSKTVTSTVTTTLTLFGTNTVTTGSFGGFTQVVQITTTVNSCTQVTIQNGTSHDEQCSLVLINTGNASVADPTQCSMMFGGATHVAQYTKDSGSLAAGSSESGTCTNTDNSVASAGEQITGTIPLADGGILEFAATAS
jgi:hypothetical protein